MQRKEAESKLTGQPDGTFLVRYSEKHNLHVLTYVRHGISKVSMKFINCYLISEDKSVFLII